MRLLSVYAPSGAQQIAGDDVALDLARAVPDALDPGVARQKRSMGRSSMSPMPPKICTASSVTRARVSDAWSFASAIGRFASSPRSRRHAAASGEPVRRVDLRHHVRELERDALKTADRLAELPAARRPVHAEVEARQRRARPTHIAATVRRVAASQVLASAKPPPSSPMSCEAGTRHSSKERMQLW